jgi:hypothetical protein
MRIKNGYIFGVLITLFASAILLVVWCTLARTTTISHSFTILGAFLLSSDLALGLFGAYLPKDDIRRGALIMSAIPGALAGMGCLFFGVAPSGVQQKQDWAPMLLGLASFVSFQILLVYLFLKVRRRQT